MKYIGFTLFSFFFTISNLLSQSITPFTVNIAGFTGQKNGNSLIVSTGDTISITDFKTDNGTSLSSIFLQNSPPNLNGIDDFFQSNEGKLTMLYTKSPYLYNDSVLNIKRFAIVNTSSLFGLVGSYYFINTAWWADSKKSFHFDGGGSNIAEAFNIGTGIGRDAKYAKQIDKLGHFYSGRIISDLYVRAIRWSGKTEQESLLWGGILGTAVHGFIEIKDGYSPTWGFSMFDWVSGSLGSFYPYFQSKSKFLNALDIKYSYYPKNNFYYDFINRRGNDFFDDYMNATFWFTFNPKRYKPTSKWPKWLGISAGIGVDETLNNYYLRMPGGDADWGKGGYEFYLAPDIDFKGLLPKRPFWQGLGHALNYIKFPSPAIRFSKDSKLMLMHF